VKIQTRSGGAVFEGTPRSSLAAVLGPRLVELPAPLVLLARIHLIIRLALPPHPLLPRFLLLQFVRRVRRLTILR